MATTPVSTARLNALDELYLHLDREEDPWSVQLELRLEGSIDDVRFENAVREAALRHPMARARLADIRGTDVRYRWEIFDDLDDGHVEVVDCGSEADIAQVRERLYSASPRLDRPGPFAIVLAHHPEGDAVMLNLHHAAGDGISTVRLMGSILRAYAGEEDPLPGVDPLAVRDAPEMG